MNRAGAQQRDTSSRELSHDLQYNGRARSERSYHVRLALGITTLVILGVAPVFVHHSAVGDEVLLQGVSEVGNSYLIATHHLLGPVHTLFHLLLFAGFFYAVADRVRARMRVRATLRSLRGAPPRQGDRFWTAATEAGIRPIDVCVVTSRIPNPAFTAGWIRPRVYVQDELAAILSASELVALLTHEAAHVARRDPLRLSALRFLVRWLFWIPLLGRLADDLADEMEVLADDRAAARDPLALASAIIRVAQWPTTNVRQLGLVGFFQHDILDRRVLRLAGEPRTIPGRATWRSWSLALAVLLLVWTSGAIVAHPMPVMQRQRAHTRVVASQSTPDRIGLWVAHVADGDAGHSAGHS